MKEWIRAELRHWRSWQPWLVLFALAGPVFVVSELSAVLGSASALSALDDYLRRILVCMCFLAVVISWGTGFTAARYSRRFAMLAMPLLALLAVAQLLRQVLHPAVSPVVADVALAAAGFVVLSLLPGVLGWRMGWREAKASWPLPVAASAVLITIVLWVQAGPRHEWAGLALMLLCAWPVFHAVGVSCRPSTARH